jgi:uncharacterized protein (DUF1778 family)
METEAERAKYMDQFEGREDELDLVPVEARIRVNKDTARAVFSLRLAPAELINISAAAKKKGMTISDFMRAAALAAASGELDADLNNSQLQVRAKLNDLLVAALSDKDVMKTVLADANVKASLKRSLRDTA